MIEGSLIFFSILNHIFNFFLFFSTFLDLLVCSSPLYSHFRPISILALLFKVLERLVRHQITIFVNSNDILSPFQSAFSSVHNILTAFTKVSDNIRENMSNEHLTILVLLDFSNAFNTIELGILLAMLKFVRVPHLVVEWFCNYLVGRRQCVRVNNKYSS